MPRTTDAIDFVKFADILAALGTEPRLRIIYHLLRAHPDGMVAGEIQNELGMQPSAVSHHLEKLKHEDLVHVQREGNFLRYTANPAVLEDLLSFLFSQCCAKTQVVPAETLLKICRPQPAAANTQKHKKETPSRCE
ncbi:ArsR/SmtB family transcription factor [Paludibaculum fermentans]|uniref:ArsR/SmtB family transcription factor n=1 Tax=Paludibaculum fermentans TaxID=1473598 RepID=UPI003EBF0619